MTFYFVYLLYTIVALLVAVPSHASLLMSKQIELSSESSLTALLSNVPYNVRLTDEASSEITCRSADAIRYPRQWELKRTALVSYPRSGNSWTRNLLQKASGYLTTSIYHDKSLYKSMPGEQFKHDNFLVKTHFPLFAENVGQTLDDLLMPSSQQAYYDQAIYLVRNPFDSILSYYQYQRGNNSHTQKVELSPEYLTVEILEPFIQWYKIFFEYWEKVRLPFLILRYEDMRKEPAEALEKIIDFLVPLPQYAHSPLGI